MGVDTDFETWAKSEDLPLNKHDGDYEDDRTYWSHLGFSAAMRMLNERAEQRRTTGIGDLIGPERKHVPWSDGGPDGY